MSDESLETEIEIPDHV